MSDKALKNIFLNEFHLENGAKFVPFAGYEMPINYKKGIINEHLHVREKAGIFDVSHMGQILIPANDKNISSLETYIPLNINNIPSIFIKNENDEILHVRLFHLAGIQQKISFTDNTVDVIEISPGLYTIHLELSSGSRILQKIIIE